VLAVNAGSSSLKFAVYPVQGADVGPAGLSGMAEGLEPGGQPVIRVQVPGQPAAKTVLSLRQGESSFESALRAVIAAVEQEGGVRLVAVAHRVVHGGTRFSASVRIDDATQAFLESLNPLAPLHQPHNLAGVKAFRKACPDIPQVACFDTAFHTTAPDLAQRFALPQSYFEQGVRRYGFHGLSYRYVSERWPRSHPVAKGGC
jgi:acetate kinase